MTTNEQKKHEGRVDAYLAKLKAVLMAPDHGDGSWPDIQPEQLREVDGLVAKLLELKWGRDCDGDQPVRFAMHYRRSHRLVWDLPVRLDNGADETIAAARQRLMGNLRTVSGGLRSYSEELHRIEQHLDELARREACLAAATPVWLVLYKKNEDWLAGEHKHDQPASLHLSEDAAAAFAPEGFERGVVKRRWAVPSTYANPTNNFAEYRAQLAAQCEAVAPRARVLEKLGLLTTCPALGSNHV